jgi:acetyltransferase
VHALDPLLRPRSVAVIGASPDPAKRGHHAVRALLESGYAGRIIPVHPSAADLLGLPVAASPAALDSPPDLVLVCTPAATVPAVLETWAQAGARGAVVLASGFAESGEAGAALEASVARVARERGIRVIGPNTSGILNVPLGLNLIGLRDVRPGCLSLLVQSGNITLQLVTEATARTAQGFSFCIGAGNETDVRFHEMLDFLATDPATRAVIMHVEGLRDGRAFLETARRVSLILPIVLVKGGRTAVGSAAARSHTGAIAGRYDVLRAGLRQAGVIEVQRTDELLHVGETLATQPALPPGRGIALLSDGGGHATLAVDALHTRGAPLAVLSAATQARLRELLGSAAAVANPVDLAGAADRAPMMFAQALEVLAQDAAVGAVLVVGLFGGYAIRFAESLRAEEEAAATAMAAVARAADCALVVHTLYALRRSSPLLALSAADVPVVESLDAACACVAGLAERGEALRRLESRRNVWADYRTETERGSGTGAHSHLHGEGADDAEAAGAARREGRAVLLETETRGVLGAHGVPLVPATFCRNRDEAAAEADRQDGPVAVRVVSPAAPHKREAGGVVLNVSGGEAAAAAFDRITDAVSQYAAARGLPADVRGVLVAPMQPRPVAELLAGVIRDPQFGPVLTLGAGGSAVEVLRDVTLRVLPVTPDEIREMIGELRIAPVLAGLRGEAGADIDAIVQATQALVQAALAHEELSEIEVNPLFAFADRCVALDARAYIMT